MMLHMHDESLVSAYAESEQRIPEFYSNCVRDSGFASAHKGSKTDRLSYKRCAACKGPLTCPEALSSVRT